MSETSSQEVPKVATQMTDIITPSECAKLAEIEAKMTPGEWEHKPTGTIVCHPDREVVKERASLLDWICSMQLSSQPNCRNDAAGIVALRNAAPRMLATIAALLAEVERLSATPAFGSWIPVAERLPTPNVWAIVFDPDHPNPGIFWDDEGRCAPTVTHWMPLPKALA